MLVVLVVVGFLMLLFMPYGIILAPLKRARVWQKARKTGFGKALKRRINTGEKSPRKQVNTAFQYVLVLYLGLLLVDEFVSITFIDLNYLLGATIILGVLTVFFPYEVKETQVRTKWDTALIWFLGVLGTVLIYIKTQDLGWLSYAISVLAGALIITMGYMIYEEDIDDSKEHADG